MPRKTAHGALKDLCLLTAQRRNHDVTFHNHPVGGFYAARDVKMLLDAAHAGRALPHIHPQTIGRKGELDTWGEIAGGRVFWVEFKGPGDALSPEQVREIARLKASRVPCYVVDAQTLDEFTAEATRFADWVASLQR